MTKTNGIEQGTPPRKWLITGGCGFIGTSLIRYLKKEIPEVQIRVMDNLSIGTRDDLSAVCQFEEISDTGPERLSATIKWQESVQLVVSDIRNYEACLFCTQGADAVVHLAANTGVAPSVENPREDMEANVIGTFNMLEALRHNRVGRFVFASSGAPIGEVEPPIHEELAPQPVSPYGASKLACEGYCSAYFHSFGVKTVSLRFGNVYGPGSGHKISVVAKFIKKAMAGLPFEIYGDGNQTRDFIYIDDLIHAILLAAVKENIGGETFQIATNRETTVTELVDKLRSVMIEQGLNDIIVKKSPPRPGDVLRNYSDTQKAQSILGWRPRIALDMGLKRTMKWFLIG